jgi:predicted phage terminase large subunit-like protein
MTRWHEDDLAGRLLAEMEQGGEPWEIVSLPALAEEGDPLGRAPGAALFKRHWFEIVGAAPDKAERIRSWDRAATQDGGDWTAGVRWAREGGTYYIEDVVRQQLAPGGRDRLIRQTAELDGRDVVIWGEQEPGAAGKSDALAFVQLLAGFYARTEPSSGDKVTRAGPMAAQAEVGNVKLVKGPWNRAFLDELCGFPLGKHDDQVDAASLGFNKIARAVQRSTRITRW